MLTVIDTCEKKARHLAARAHVLPVRSSRGHATIAAAASASVFVLLY
jgi:hypothetical protein